MHQRQGNFCLSTKVAGSSGVITPTGDADSNDFELKSTSEHLYISDAAQGHHRHRSKQQQHRGYLPTDPSPYPTPPSPPPHTEGSNSVLEYIATGIPPRQSVKRPIVKPVPATVGAGNTPPSTHAHNLY